MLKPVVFLKPRNVGGPLFQAGEVAGFMPELAAALIADGSARAAEPEDQSPAAVDPDQGPVIPASSFPFSTDAERQAARKKGVGGKR